MRFVRLFIGLYFAGLLVALAWMIAALLNGLGVASLPLAPGILIGGMALVLASKIGALCVNRVERRHG